MLFSITKRWVSKTSKRHHNLFKNKKKKRGETEKTDTKQRGKAENYFI